MLDWVYDIMGCLSESEAAGYILLSKDDNLPACMGKADTVFTQGASAAQQCLAVQLCLHFTFTPVPCA
jgi:hypothetical protein